jgi:hypothetical protein
VQDPAALRRENAKLGSSAQIWAVLNMARFVLNGVTVWQKTTSRISGEQI